MTTPTSLDDNSLFPQPVCPYCDGMGFVTKDVPTDHRDFGKAFPCVCKVEELSIRHEHRVLRLSHLDSYRNFQFENFNREGKELSSEQKRTLHIAYDFVYEYAQSPKGWLLLQGGYGTGKTHLAAAAGNVLQMNGHEIIFVSVPDLLDHLRSTFMPDTVVTYDELFERIRNIEILILDDLGSESPTPWAVEKLYQLLNYRYVERLPTIITTNYRLEKFDERIASRALDGRMCTIVQMNLPDFRRTGVERAQDRSDLPGNLSLYQNMIFEHFHIRNFDIPTEESESLYKALKAAIDYSEEPNGWIVFHGNHGCGKTHLAAAIANKRNSLGTKVLLFTTADLLDQFFQGIETASLSYSFQEIRTVPLLVLDDFHLNTANVWAAEKLFQIINYRYIAQLHTVITITRINYQNLSDRFKSRMKDHRLVEHVVIGARDYEGGPKMSNVRKLRP